MEKDVVVFEDPWRRDEFRSINFRKFDLPQGVSALQFLRRELSPLPRACFPQPGDVQENNLTAVVRLDDLDYESEVMIRAPIRSLTVTGDAMTPGVVIIDRNNVVYEPDGDQNFLRPTTTKMVAQECDPVTHINIDSSSEEARTERLRQMLLYMPQHFIGKVVYQYFEEHEAVFSGVVTGWDQRNATENVFSVLWSDGWNPGFIYGHDEMDRYGIRFVDGTSEGALKDMRQSGGNVAIQRKVSIEDAESDDEDALPADADNPGVVSNVSWVRTTDHETWVDLCARWELDERNQKLYFAWLKENFKRGNCAHFKNAVGCVYFPNPIRARRKRRKGKGGGGKTYHFRAGTRMPEPRGKEWETFVDTMEGGSNAADDDELIANAITDSI